MTKRRSITPAPSATQTARKRKAAPRQATSIPLSVADQVMRVKIALGGIRPTIWRRILVPADATFFDLHVAINAAMGWTDSHLHQFVLGDRRRGAEPIFIGVPDEEEFSDLQTLPGWEESVLDRLQPGSACIYEYDFGDGWEHEVAIEAFQPREPDKEYPRCVDGKRACPPEDCGGVPGYLSMNEILADPEHEEYEEMRVWAGDFDPDAFDPRSVEFPDPRERLREWLD